MEKKYEILLILGSIITSVGIIGFLLKNNSTAMINLINPTNLAKLYSNTSAATINTFVPYLNEYMSKYGINTYNRLCAFLAQIGHESGGLKYTKELASGEAYEGRADLGNNQPGDGVKFKGRGLIQLTGRANYEKMCPKMGLDLIKNPELLEQPKYATQSACIWWRDRGLNELADNPSADQFIAITKKINGGTNGLANRQALWETAKKIFV